MVAAQQYYRLTDQKSGVSEAKAYLASGSQSQSPDTQAEHWLQKACVLQPYRSNRWVLP